MHNPQTSQFIDNWFWNKIAILWWIFNLKSINYFYILCLHKLLSQIPRTVPTEIKFENILVMNFSFGFLWFLFSVIFSRIRQSLKFYDKINFSWNSTILLGVTTEYCCYQAWLQNQKSKNKTQMVITRHPASKYP